ncbi:MAG: DUF3103 family protein [candidate division WOR-3 bacterium]
MKIVKWGIGISIMMGVLTGCKKEQITGIIEKMDKNKGYILSGSSYNFHYLTFVEEGVQSGSSYLGKDISILTLNTIKRWANQGFGNFTPPSTRTAFVNKIEAVIKQIENSAYNAAENKVANDIIPFMESKVTGPFRQTFGLLLESSLVGIIQAEDTIEIDVSYYNVLNANPYSLQKIKAIICKPYQFVCELIVPEPTLEDSLQAVACALAMGLCDNENRQILFYQLENSPYFHHKIYAEKYFNTVREDGRKILSTLSLNSGYSEEYLNSFISSHKDWGVYFPDTFHYAQWKKNNGNILPWVSYTPAWLDDLDWNIIIGFDSKGSMISLDAWNAPSYPVLIVTAEPPETMIVEEDTIPIPQSEYYRALMRGMKITANCEPWPGGPMEIYTLCITRGDGVYPSCDEVLSNGQSTQFPGVDWPNQWYQTPRCKRRVFGICVEWDYRGKPLVNTYHYWPYLNVKGTVIVMEDDWSGDPDDYLGCGNFSTTWDVGGVPTMDQIPTVTIVGAQIKPYFYRNY